MKIEMDWFDQLQINWEQAPDGFIAIHAYKKGRGCRYFEVPKDWEYKANFLEMVYAQSIMEWNKPRPPHPPKCLVCQRSLLDFDFRYKGKYFCRYCGSHYRIERGKIIVERSIIETE